MSIYTTPLSRIGAADLQELMAEGAVENVRLEFESEVPNKDETLKKLSRVESPLVAFCRECAVRVWSKWNLPPIQRRPKLGPVLRHHLAPLRWI